MSQRVTIFAVQSMAECLEELAREAQETERKQLADLIWSKLYAQYQDKAPSEAA